MTFASHILPGVEANVPKKFRQETHRTTSPSETVAHVKTLMPRLGITRIANLTGLDRIGVPVVAVYRPGKGLNLPAAQASGLMESVETYHAENIALPLRLASYRELRRTHRTVQPELLTALPNSLYHPDLRILWIEGFDIVQQEPAWVPYELVHMDYTLPQPTGSGCFQGSSNGLSSGNHILEALTHGLCEVVERHSATLWKFQSEAVQRHTRVNPDTVDDPGCCEVLEKFRRAAIDMVVWDITSEIGIPAFACTIMVNPARASHELYLNSGMGCHPTRQIALLRALTEAAQTRLTFISGARDDITRRDYSVATDRDETKDFREWVNTIPAIRAFAEVPSCEWETFDEEIAWEVEQLKAVGINQVIVLNISKIELGVPVVRVIIPGLEGPSDRAGYVPGPRARAVLASQQ